MKSNNRNKDKSKAGRSKGSERSKDTRTKSTNDATNSSETKNARFSDTQGLPKSNPFEWYNRNPQLLQSVARIPFPNRPGMAISYTSTEGQGNKTIIPSVMSIRYVPGTGFGYTNVDPASQTAKEIYARVRSSFSATLPEDAPDILIYLLALDSIFSNIALMKRVYRIVNSYSQNNYAMPHALLVAMGFTDSEIISLRNNWTQGWGLINEVVLMSRKFVCPEVFDLFNRHYWMNDNVYKDSPSEMAQMYMFVPEHCYMFEEGVAPQGSRLVPTTLGNFFTSWESMANLIRKQIDTLSQSLDAYTISGHLMRAYEGSKAFVVQEIPQFELLVPEYDPIVLTQIENLCGVGPYSGLEPDSLYINQNPNTNAIAYTPVISATQQPVYKWNTLLNLRSDLPDVTDVTEASRLTAVLGDYGTYGDMFQFTGIPIYCGSEFVTTMNVYFYNAYTDETDVVPIQSRYTNAQFDVISIAMQAMSSFDWGPFLLFSNNEGGGVLPFGDIYNITTINEDAMKQIHKVCLYSEFNSFSL